MSHHVVTLEINTPICVVTQTMFEQHIRRLPIVEGEKLVSIVTRQDLVKLVAAGIAKNAGRS